MPSPGSMPASRRRRHLSDGAPGGDRAVERVRAGLQREVPELHLHGDRAARAALAPQHGGDRLGHAQRVALQLGRVDQILAERLLVADRLGGPVRAHRFGVLTPGQCGQVHPAGLAQPAHQGVGRQVGQLPHRAHAQVVQSLGRGRSHAPEGLDVVSHGGRRAPRRARPGTRRAPVRDRGAWPGAWPPARRAWRSSSNARCPPRSAGASRRPPARRRPRAMTSGGPSRRSAPATSMKASSSPIGSTIGVTSWRMRCSCRAHLGVAAVATRR